MPSEVEVMYDGRRPWDPLADLGLAVGTIVPFVQFEREPIFFGGKWGQVANITLTGEIPLGRIDPGQVGAVAPGYSLPYPQGLDLLNDVRDEIVEVFSKSLRTFYFKDTNGNEKIFHNAIVQSIDFPSSGYHGLLEYSISLKCYEQDYFMAQGIVDAQDEFSTTENENGTISVTHSISARGANYIDSANNEQHGLANAIAWVDSRKGDQYKSEQGLYKAWHGGTKSGLANPQIYLLLISQDETIDRLTGTYEVSETFLGYLDEVNNASVAAGGVKKYGKKFTVDINESLNASFNIVNISGEYLGGKETSLAELRNGFLTDNGGDPEGMLFNEAERLSGFDGSSTLNGIPPFMPELHDVPVGYSLEENETEKSIKIKATFDTNPLFVDADGNPSRYYFDYNVTVDLDEIRKISKVTIDGELKVRGLSTERQFYIKDFLNNFDVMSYLHSFANTEHELVMKECWECSNNKWVRAGIGSNDPGNAAGFCVDINETLVGTAPERCHELSSSATSLSVVKNEVQNSLNMSATFSDRDTLPMSDDPNSKDFAEVSFSVDVRNPIEYTKAHASAQAKYNGHYSIQRFGIQTRAKSNVKVDLTFREDAGVALLDVEPKLREKALEIQSTLNGMLGQTESYDAAESINHKTSQSDSIVHSLQRSYVPETENIICVDLPDVESTKYCYMCLDGNSNQVGDRVYASSIEHASELCDQKTPNELGSLNPETCDHCWNCYDSGGAFLHQVTASSESGAANQCVGTVQPCDLSISEKCYKCEDSNEGVYVSEVYAISLAAAQTKCDEHELAPLTAVICPVGSGDCYLCSYAGVPIATVYASTQSDADAWCNFEYPLYQGGLTASTPCDGVGGSECYNCVTNDDPPETIGTIYAGSEAEAQAACDQLGEESVATLCQ